MTFCVFAKGGIKKNKKKLVVLIAWSKHQSGGAATFYDITKGCCCFIAWMSFHLSEYKA